MVAFLFLMQLVAFAYDYRQMNPSEKLDHKELEIKQLDIKRDEILDKKVEERSGSENVFLFEYKDKLAKLEADKEWLKKLVEDEKKKGILIYINF